jgi:hypothetical protein
MQAAVCQYPRDRAHCIKSTVRVPSVLSQWADAWQANPWDPRRFQNHHQFQTHQDPSTSKETRNCPRVMTLPQGIGEARVLKTITANPPPCSAESERCCTFDSYESPPSSPFVWQPWGSDGHNTCRQVQPLSQPKHKARSTAPATLITLMTATHEGAEEQLHAFPCDGTTQQR